MAASNSNVVHLLGTLVVVFAVIFVGRKAWKKA